MILIRNGTLIDPASGTEGEFDLLIEGNRIKDVAKRGSFSSVAVTQTIEATERWVTPGLIDLHVHLREPGFEWKETVKSGADAAINGGFTSVCCMPNTNPVNDSEEVTRYIIERAQAAGSARVHPIGAVSLRLEGKEMAPYSELRSAGCVAFSDDGEPVYNAGLMRRALDWCRMLGITISCHEEDKSLTCGGCMNESSLGERLGLKGMPKVAEEVMIARDIELCRSTGARVHICHVSTARGVELLRRAKNDGIAITAEVTPHHLFLTEDALVDYDTNCKMSPPLRDEEDRLALIAGLRDGTIDAVASDHAPHDRDTKEIEFGKAAFGILGLQTSLPLLLDFVRRGLISRRRAIEVFTSGPAKVFGLPLGVVQKGALADVSIINPEQRWNFTREEVRSVSFNSPFIGRELQGCADTVIVGGRIVLQDRKLIASLEAHPSPRRGFASIEGLQSVM